MIILLMKTHETSQQFEKYFAANAVEKGGSFYLQSKVYRAKQMLDQFIAEKKLEDKEAREKEASQKWCRPIDWFLAKVVVFVFVTRRTKVGE